VLNVDTGEIQLVRWDRVSFALAFEELISAHQRMTIAKRCCETEPMNNLDLNERSHLCPVAQQRTLTAAAKKMLPPHRQSAGR
jgi:hypothetical protein